MPFNSGLGIKLRRPAGVHGLLWYLRKQEAFVRVLTVFTFLIAATALSAHVDLSELKGSVLEVFKIFRAPWDRRGQDKERPVFQKPHGFAYAKFVVAGDLPPEFRVGVFAEARSYQAWLRFSSDTPSDPGDQAKNTLGFAIKLLAADPSGDQPSQDFLLQNHPAFFTDNSAELAALFNGSLGKTDPKRLSEIQANLDAMDRDVETYLAGRPWTMKKPVPSVLSTKYWSAVPYRFGRRFAKYYLEPRLRLEGVSSSGDPDYLKKDLAARLSSSAHCFDLYVQLADDTPETPVEKASQVWDEAKTPGVLVGTLMIPAGQDPNPAPEVTESLAFRPGNALPEHFPAGELNLARARIYQKMWELRRQKHGLRSQDPTHIEADGAGEKLSSVSCEDL